MLKINITIKEKTDKSGNCTVTMEKPKNIDKASDSEKNITAGIYEAITKTLEELQNK